MSLCHSLLFETPVDQGPLSHICSFLSLREVYTSLPLVNRAFYAAANACVASVSFTPSHYEELYSQEPLLGFSRFHHDNLLSFLIRENPTFDPTIRVLLNMGEYRYSPNHRNSGCWFVVCDAAMACARFGLPNTLSILMDDSLPHRPHFFGTEEEFVEQWEHFADRSLADRPTRPRQPSEEIQAPHFVLRLYSMFRLAEHYFHFDVVRLLLHRLRGIPYDLLTECFLGYSNSRTSCQRDYQIHHQRFYNCFRRSSWLCDVWCSEESDPASTGPLSLLMDRLRDSGSWYLEGIEEPYPWIIREVNVDSNRTAPAERDPPIWMVEAALDTAIDESYGERNLLRNYSEIAVEGMESAIEREEISHILRRLRGVFGCIWSAFVRTTYQKLRSEVNEEVVNHPLEMQQVVLVESQQAPEEQDNPYGRMRASELLDYVIDALLPISEHLNRIFEGGNERIRGRLADQVIVWMRAAQYSSYPDREMLVVLVRFVPSIVKSPEFCTLLSEAARRSGGSMMSGWRIMIQLICVEEGRVFVGCETEEEFEQSGLPIALRGERRVRLDQCCEDLRMTLCWVFCAPCCLVFGYLWARSYED